MSLKAAGKPAIPPAPVSMACTTWRWKLRTHIVLKLLTCLTSPPQAWLHGIRYVLMLLAGQLLVNERNSLFFQVQLKVLTSRERALNRVAFICDSYSQLFNSRVRRAFKTVAECIVRDGCSSLWNVLSSLNTLQLRATLTAVVEAKIQDHIEWTLSHLRRCCLGNVSDADLTQARVNIAEAGSAMLDRLLAESKACVYDSNYFCTFLHLSRPCVVTFCFATVSLGTLAPSSNSVGVQLN